MRRTLSLKREVLQELTATDLADVVGGGVTDVTCLSCLDYISCWTPQCLRDTLICPE